MDAIFVKNFDASNRMHKVAQEEAVNVFSLSFHPNKTVALLMWMETSISMFRYAMAWSHLDMHIGSRLGWKRVVDFLPCRTNHMDFLTK